MKSNRKKIKKTTEEKPKAQDVSLSNLVIPTAQAKPSIAELEQILDSEEETPIEILPNGEIRALGTQNKNDTKPLTMREYLGGEYAQAV
jgi:hypothetical protein